MIAPALTKLRIMAPMVRPTQLLHPQREPAPVRPAATVLLLRDTPQGIEVLMTRRSMTASFAPGAYVFPGGGVDALDAAAHAQASRRETQSDLHLTQAIAAIRESFEELGILLARREDGTMANANDIAALQDNGRFAQFTKEPLQYRLQDWPQAIEISLAKLSNPLARARHLDLPGLKVGITATIAQHAVALAQRALVTTPILEKPVFHVEHPPIEIAAAFLGDAANQLV